MIPDITTGDNLNGWSIGNHGMQSGDVANIIISAAEAQRLADERQKAESRKNALLLGGAAWVTVLLVIVLVYLKKRNTT